MSVQPVILDSHPPLYGMQFTYSARRAEHSQYTPALRDNMCGERDRPARGSGPGGSRGEPQNPGHGQLRERHRLSLDAARRRKAEHLLSLPLGSLIIIFRCILDHEVVRVDVDDEVSKVLIRLRGRAQSPGRSRRASPGRDQEEQ